MTPVANILQPLIDAFDWVLTFFHDSVGLSWGMSIIALTVAVRALLLPLAFKQFHSMRALQEAAPQMKALQEKYKDDKQRLNQEMMRFYQENKINPFSSCLPLVAQLPVFLSLFYLLRQDLRIDICQQTTPCGDAAAWWFIPDLTDKATGGVLVALLVLYVGSQVLSSVLMSVTADRNQRLLFIALPFVFVPFIVSFPAGLILYWITTNLWTVVQQTILRKQAGMPVGIRSRPAPAPAAALADGKAVRQGRNGDRAATSARPSGPPPPPPRARKKKKTGRRR